MKQGVLLAARETVDLIDEENRALAVHEQALACSVNLAAQVLDGARNGADLHEHGVGALGDNMCDRGLARAGGAVQDHGGERVALDCATKPGTLADCLLLTDDLRHGAGTHAHGQRRSLEANLIVYLCEEAIHSIDIHADHDTG